MFKFLKFQCSKLSAASKFSKKPTNSGPQNASSADQKPTSQDPQRGLIETFLLFFKIPNNKKRNKRKFYQIFIFITYEINIQMIDLLFLLFARASVQHQFSSLNPQLWKITSSVLFTSRHSLPWGFLPPEFGGKSGKNSIEWLNIYRTRKKTYFPYVLMLHVFLGFPSQWLNIHMTRKETSLPHVLIYMSSHVFLLSG